MNKLGKAIAPTRLLMRGLPLIVGQLLFDLPLCYAVNWTLTYTRSGDAAFDGLGSASAWVGDVNGDGHDDFAFGIGAGDPGGLLDAGYVLIYSGADGSLLYRKDGEQSGDAFGFAVAGLGDLNVDGFAEFAIGAPWSSYNNDVRRGLVYVYSGVDGSQLTRVEGHPDLTISRLGYAIASIGDIDGDNVPDFAAGAPFTQSPSSFETGCVLVISGADFGELYYRYGPRHLMFFGHAVASLGGDVNQDAVPDFIVGAPNDTYIENRFQHGTAFVCSGVDGATVYTQAGDNSNDNLGWSVTGPGDLSGDGVVDFVVGAFNARATGGTRKGRIYVYRSAGASHFWMYSKEGTASFDWFGLSLSALGDVDGDDRGDFVVGAPRADADAIPDAGTVIVYSGAAPGAILFQTFGDSTGIEFGHSVSGNGDRDANLKADLVVGSWYSEPGGITAAGSGLVYSFDCACAPHGDTNGDGVSDVLDLVRTIAVVFGGLSDSVDSSCPHIGRSDHNCDCQWDIRDVRAIIAQAWNGAPPACQPCFMSAACR